VVCGVSECDCSCGLEHRFDTRGVRGCTPYEVSPSGGLSASPSRHDEVPARIQHALAARVIFGLRLVPPALPGDLPAHLQRRRSAGFTCGHASWPHVVDVMERIKTERS
jgi:hypothetical protein